MRRTNKNKSIKLHLEHKKDDLVIGGALSMLWMENSL